jgi:hypothetical protein
VQYSGSWSASVDNKSYNGETMVMDFETFRHHSYGHDHDYVHYQSELSNMSTDDMFGIDNQHSAHGRHAEDSQDNYSPYDGSGIHYSQPQYVTGMDEKYMPAFRHGAVPVRAAEDRGASYSPESSPLSRHSDLQVSDPNPR